MSTTIGWRAVESEGIPMEASCSLAQENAHNEAVIVEQASVQGIRKKRILLRIVTVIRLLITILVTVSILRWDKTKGYCMGGSSGGYRNQGAQLEAIEKRLNEEASDNGAASELFRYHRVLFIHAFTILSTAFMWAGAFMNKKHGLPICAILEIILSSRFILSMGAFRNLSALRSLIVNAKHSQMAIAIHVVFLLIFLSYCALFIPKVLLRYYKYLNSKDQAREKAIYGNESDKIVKMEQIILRCFAVIRLVICIAATLLILHWHDVHMVCWSYYYDGGFLDPQRPMDTIQKRLDSIADNRIEAPRIYRFDRAIVLDLFNIAITALLWAGAFARKKNCLPIYAILEICLIAFAAFDQISRPLMFWPMLIVLIGYCAVFLPMVLLRYYKHLDSKYRTRKNLPKDETSSTITAKTLPAMQNLLTNENHDID